MSPPVNPNEFAPRGPRPEQSPPAPMPKTSNVDPTGAWQKFLSVGGNQASPEEVKMFIQGLLKMFNVMIQQQQQAAQKANRRLKEIAEKGYSDEM